MFMHDASRCATAVWTHRVLASIARSVGDGCNDVARLAGTLSQAPWWEGCPAAADIAPSNGGSRYRRVSLREPIEADDYSVSLMVWPVGHVTPIHDEVLQVEAFTMTVAPALVLAPRNTTRLGIGDHTTFSERDYPHRCRNLSAQRPALSRHVYGGALERYRAYGRDAVGRWCNGARRAELKVALR